MRRAWHQHENVTAPAEMCVITKVEAPFSADCKRQQPIARAV